MSKIIKTYKPVGCFIALCNTNFFSDTGYLLEILNLCITTCSAEKKKKFLSLKIKQITQVIVIQMESFVPNLKGNPGYAISSKKQFS